MKKIIILIALWLLLLALAPASRADDESDLQDRIGELQGELDDLQQAQRDQESYDRFHCGPITGWARGWYKHEKRHGH